MKTFEKIDDTQFKVIDTTPVEIVRNIVDLKNDRKIYENAVIRYQAKIDEIDSLLREAAKVGVADELVIDVII